MQFFKLFLAVLSIAVPWVPLPVMADENRFTLDYETWSRPRDGQAVRELDAVAGAMRRWQQNSGAMLDIRYPGGEIGSLWAAELRDWMVSLGLPGDHVQLTPGSSQPDRIDIDVLMPSRLTTTP